MAGFSQAVRISFSGTSSYIWVDSVRVVPENPEIIRGCFHGSKFLYHSIAVADTLRVGVQRDTPDALDLLVVFDQFFHLVHIQRLPEDGQGSFRCRVLRRSGSGGRSWNRA
mgnify:CR=1 FL=1